MAKLVGNKPFVKSEQVARVFKPVSPVVPGRKLAELVFAKNQPQYIPMPAVRNHSNIVTVRWKMSWRDRLLVFWNGYVYTQLLTAGSPQPQKVFARPPSETSIV